MYSYSYQLYSFQLSFKCGLKSSNTRMVLQVVSIAGRKEGLCYPQFYKNKGPVKRNLDVETKKIGMETES